MSHHKHNPRHHPHVEEKSNAAITTSSTTMTESSIRRRLIQDHQNSNEEFQNVVEALSYKYKRLVHDSDLEKKNVLSRKKLDAAVEMLLTLISSAPHSAVLKPLAQQVLRSIYVEDENEQKTNNEDADQDSSPFSNTISPYGSSLATKTTYYELVSELKSERTSIESELSRVETQVEFYDRNSGGHKEILFIAISKWQKSVSHIAFMQWKSNVRCIQQQRRNLQKVLAKWSTRTKKFQLKLNFLQWKIFTYSSLYRTLVPRVEMERLQKTELEHKISETTYWISETNTKIKSLLEEISAESYSFVNMQSQVMKLQQKLSTYAAFRLQDVSYAILELIREMCLTLEDELEFSEHFYEFDIFRLFLPELLPLNSSVLALSSANPSSKSDSKSDEKAAQLKEDRIELEREVLSSIDTNAYDARLTNMTEQQFLLLWFNFHLYEAFLATPALYPYISRLQVENFTTDLKDSLALLLLVERIAPTPALAYHCIDARMEIDEESRARLLIAILYEFDKDAANMLGADQILSSSFPDLMTVCLGKLCCHHFSVKSKSAISRHLQTLNEIKTEWEAMTTRVHKLKQNTQQRESEFFQEKQQIWQERQARADLKKEGNKGSSEISMEQPPSEVNPSESVPSAEVPPGDVSSTTGNKPALSAELNLAPTATESSEPLPSSATPMTSPGFATSFDELPANDARQYSAYVEKFLHQFLNLYKVCRAEIDRKRFSHLVTLQHLSRMQRYTLNALTQRVQYKPIVVENMKEKRDKQAFTNLPLKHFVECYLSKNKLENHSSNESNAPNPKLGVAITDTHNQTTIPYQFPSNPLSEHELMLIQSELTASYVELKKTFRFYATNETASGYSMDKNDTILFLTDCKLINNGKMKFSTYEEMFLQCAEKLPNNRMNWNDLDGTRPGVQIIDGKVVDDKSEENKSFELTANRFVSFLLSIASMRYSQAALISDRLAMLLRHYVLKNARKLDSETFHLRIRNGEMSDIFRQYRKRLRRIFLHLANHSTTNATTTTTIAAISNGLAPDSTTAVSPAPSHPTPPPTNAPLTISVSLTSFIAFLRSSKLVDTEMISLSTFSSLCRQVCYGEYCVSPSYLFMNSLTSPNTGNSSTTNTTLLPSRDIRLEFVHFTEALTALAVFRYPDPYTPMHRRVENFLSRDLNVILR